MIETTNITGRKIREYLATGKRFDGRKPEEFRDLIIETGVSKNAEGSARVKLGKTEVVVGVKLGVTAPYDDSPSDGNLMVTSELLPLSSPRFEGGPPKFPSIELGRLIDRGIRESKFIQLDKLCIKEGEKVWNVFIDIYSINDDGNLLDAAGIGAVVALKAAKIPKYDEETGKVLFGELTDENVPLSDNTPVSITVHKIGKSLFVDPTLEEEDISETRITNAGFGDRIYSMQKGNKGILTEEELDKVFELSIKARKDILAKIDKAIK